MSKKLLTLNDLYNYFLSSNKSVKFSSKDNDNTIVVHTKGNLNFEDDVDLDTEGLVPVTLKACHTNENLNHSNIPKKVMKAALPSFSLRPILGYIHYVDDEPHFYGHNMHKDKDKGLIYDEIPIGVIKENCNAHFEKDEEHDRDYVIVDGYIFDNYTKAAEILRREKECPVSVELSIRELSFNAKTKTLIIEDFYFSAVTILGVDEDGDSIDPGMQGSNITLADFSKENNSVSNKSYEEELIKVLNNINDTLISIKFNKSNNTEEGGIPEVTKFEELLEKYNKTKEDITFEVEGMTDEELETKFEELFGEHVVEDKISEENKEVKDTNNSTEDEKPKNEDESDEHADVPVIKDEDSTKAENALSDNTGENTEDSTEEYSITSVIKANGKEYAFSVSLNDKIASLSQLINETYSDSDNVYYSVIVYDKEVVMIDYWSGKAYRQNYKSRNDVLSLIGDRVPVHAIYVTDDEETSLNELRGNYSSLSEKFEKTQKELNNYKYTELRTQKKALLNSEDYSVLSKDENFQSLIQDMDNYSLEELSSKADIALAKFVKANKTFATETKSVKKNKITFSLNEISTEEKPYGDLFDEK